MAWQAARDDVRTHGSLEVPKELRNAPTALMRELGHGTPERRVGRLLDDGWNVLIFPEGANLTPERRRLGAEHHGEAEVDGVAKEDAGKRRRQHRGHAECLEHGGRLLTRRADAKVATGRDDVAGLHLARELGAD